MAPLEGPARANTLARLGQVKAQRDAGTARQSSVLTRPDGVDAHGGGRRRRRPQRDCFAMRCVTLERRTYLRRFTQPRNPVRRRRRRSPRLRRDCFGTMRCVIPERRTCPGREAQNAPTRSLPGSSHLPDSIKRSGDWPTRRRRPFGNTSLLPRREFDSSPTPTPHICARIGGTSRNGGGSEAAAVAGTGVRCETRNRGVGGPGMAQAAARSERQARAPWQHDSAPDFRPVPLLGVSAGGRYRGAIHRGKTRWKSKRRRSLRLEDSF